MLKTIVDSYKLYLKNFPIILLYAVPLLVLATIEIFFQGLNSQNSGVIYYIAIASFIMPLVSSATDIAVYKRLFGFSNVNPFNNLKTLFIYMFVQLGLGLVAVLPIFVINWLLLQYWPSPLCVICVSLLINMFFGIYFLARFNIILPLIVQERVPSLKDFVTYTDFSYKKWLMVAFLIYMPYIIINYLFNCPYLHMGLTNLYMLMFVCFNTVYVMKHRLHNTPAGDTVAVRHEPSLKKAPVAEKIHSQPVAKPAVVKPSPVKEPAPKKLPVKKPAPQKAPKPVKPSFEPA